MTRNKYEARVEDVDLGYDDFKDAVSDWEGGIFADIGMLKEDFDEEEVFKKGFQNEFGAVVKGKARDGSTVNVRIPARPHHRTAFDAAWRGYMRRLQHELRNPTDADFKDALDDVGKEHRAFLQKLIEDYANPKNAEFTIAKKGEDDPLVETGDMLRGIDYRIHDDRKLGE